jgi:hypothetical protein
MTFYPAVFYVIIIGFFTALFLGKKATYGFVLWKVAIL